MGKKIKREKMYDVQPIRTVKEIEEMKWALRRFCSERDWFMFLLGINCGLRISDILKLKAGDIRYVGTRIIETKTGKINTINNMAAIKAEIEAYTAKMNDDDWLFPSRKGNGHITVTQAYRVLAKAGKQLGRTDIGTHTMRKTFGHHLYQFKKDVAVVQQALNHASPSITKGYIGITQDEIDQALVGFKL